VGADPCRAAGTRAPAPGAQPHSQCGGPGQPEREDHRKRGPHGFDGAKKLNGRKRHLLVDTLGLVCKVHVTPADISDRDGAVGLLRRMDWRRFPRLRYGWVDQAYRGEFLAQVKQAFGVTLQVVVRADGGRRGRWLPPGVEPPPVPAFQVVPRRWVVERSFAWLGRSRRLARDYEFLPATSEAVIYLAASHLLVRRLAGSGPARQHRLVRPPVAGCDPPAARARSSGSPALATAPPAARG
jgi:transposase